MIKIESVTKEVKNGLVEFLKHYPEDVEVDEVFNDLFDITIGTDVPVIVKFSNRLSDSVTLYVGGKWFEVPRDDIYKFSII